MLKVVADNIHDTPPFDGPYRKVTTVFKDRFGNIVKNPAKHLARLEARKLEESLKEEK